LDLLRELLTKLFFLRLLRGLFRKLDDMIFFCPAGVHSRSEWLVLNSPMSSRSTFKCLNCNEKQRREPRCGSSQRFCSKPDCRRASKAASQRKWASSSKNQNYFRGAENCERVRQWRLAHPGYWRTKRSTPKSALQEISPTEIIDKESVAQSIDCIALQEICGPQPALLVGLISVLTGHALQEDLLASARKFLHRGHDILSKKAVIRDLEPTATGVVKTPSAKAQKALVSPSRGNRTR
jgi:hypothetical protein